MTTTNFINLTRGIYCAHAPDILTGPVNWVRIQSTQCEQKMWPEILRGLGAQFYMATAYGPVVVHDCSERNRETRAMWQGLSWIRYVLNRVWYNQEVTETSRSGMNTTHYWRRNFENLSKADIRAIRYFTPLDDGREQVSLESCWKR